MQLPIMGSPEEAFEFGKYLSMKVNGSTIDDAKAAVDKKLVDPRKVTAYIAWGFVMRDGEKLKLTTRGRQMLKAESQEEKNAIYREVIRSIDAYQSMIENIYYDRDRQIITNIEAATYWSETKKFEMSSENEATLKDRAVCFFKVCEAAGLGRFCLGRRGLQTRLELSREAIREYVEVQNEDYTDEVVVTEESLKTNENIKGDVEYKKNDQDGIVPLMISFIDGRQAVLNMPKNVSKEDAEYVYEMLQLILKRQYGLDNK